jgi:D-serine deaminase-like pyridoxal phosphate-dependent protein
MCDAGAIAMSKDTGPIGGYGKVEGKSWTLSKVSQEHGILRRASLSKDTVQIGEQVRIIGQHACLIAAAHSWYYIVDSSEGAGGTVVDVWVPWKGW